MTELKQGSDNRYYKLHKNGTKEYISKEDAEAIMLAQKINKEGILVLSPNGATIEKK